MEHERDDEIKGGTCTCVCPAGIREEEYEAVRVADWGTTLGTRVPDSSAKQRSGGIDVLGADWRRCTGLLGRVILFESKEVAGVVALR